MAAGHGSVQPVVELIVLLPNRSSGLPHAIIDFCDAVGSCRENWSFAVDGKSHYLYVFSRDLSGKLPDSFCFSSATGVSDEFQILYAFCSIKADGSGFSHILMHRSVRQNDMISASLCLQLLGEFMRDSVGMTVANLATAVASDRFEVLGSCSGKDIASVVFILMFFSRPWHSDTQK